MELFEGQTPRHCDCSVWNRMGHGTGRDWRKKEGAGASELSSVSVLTDVTL